MTAPMPLFTQKMALDKTPLDPFTLHVRPNPGRVKPRQYAIVSYHRLHPHHNLVGYKQGFGEPYAGLYVYNFVHWFTAARVAHEIVASGRTIWAGEG